VADGWCWFVLREEYCWLVVGGWFVLREKYCWLVADKLSEQADGFLSSYHVIVHERPSLLNEPCHGKGKVLHRPVRHSTSKLGKP
jgi:hypothetical protein